MADNLKEEAENATQLLAGKTVALVRRHRPAEVMIEFTDGTRLFVDRSEFGVELSVADGGE